MTILASSLALANADYSWRRKAICRDTDPDLFFPVGTTGQALVQIDRAKEVCGECPVQRRLPRVRARDQPGLGHLGRPRRGGAPRRSAARTPPASACSPDRRTARSTPSGTASTAQTTGTVRRTTVPAPSRCVARCPTAVEVLGRRPRRIVMRAAELGRHQRAHDRQAEAGRLVELERRGRARRRR